jgi:hypothetical protein
MTNVRGLVDSRYFETLDRKTQLPSPPEDNVDVEEKPSSRFFTYTELKTGKNRKGSVPTTFFKSNATDIRSSQYEGIRSAGLVEDNNYYKSILHSPIPEDKKELPVPLTREPTIDLGEHEPQFSVTSGVSLMQVEHVTVMNMNDKYSIILKYEKGKSLMIHRSFSEIYAFHLQLLEMFPGHAGVDLSPRIIPYLSPPSSNDMSNMVNELETYLLESMRLPETILSSRHWFEFLKLRYGDEELGESQMNDENMILSFIEEYTKPTIVKVKFSLSTGQAYSFKAEKNSSHRVMVKSLESRLKLKQGINELFYWNEMKQLTKVHGDLDLQILFRTCPKPYLYSK